MTFAPYTLDPDTPQSAPMGLIVLQTDETIEPEMQNFLGNRTGPLFVTRIPSGAEVTPDTLAAMERDLPASADLLPKAREYAVVGYGCTSGASIIGSNKVSELVRLTCKTRAVTNPLLAATERARALGVSRFALVSPYIEAVNEPLRSAFAQQGISMDSFTSFGVPTEQDVVRISPQSIVDAALSVGKGPEVEAVFLSCTNLRTITAIPLIEAELGKPVISSNSALAWHMKSLANSTWGNSLGC